MENDQPSPSRLPQIFFGLVLVLVIIGVIWFFVAGNSDTSENTLPAPVFSLDITSPRANIATESNSLTVTGATGVPSIVTIIGPSETKVLQGDSATFSTTLTLVEGKNIIDITAFNPKDGASVREVREVLYLEGDLSSL